MKNINKINISIEYFGVFKLFILSILYSLLLGIVAWVWKLVVENISERKLSTKIVWIYLKTFIAKYVPGNIFHYVTRQIEMSKEGISHKVLAKGNMIEFLYLIFSSIFVILLVLINDMTLFDIFIQKYPNVAYLNIILLSVSLFLFILGVNKISYMLYLLYYGIFFIGLGLITHYIANSILRYDISFFFSIFIFTVSWLIGTLMPGVPGGIGVRESVFVVLSENMLVDYDALLLAVLLRVVTVGGEVLCYLGAIFILRAKVDT